MIPTLGDVGDEMVYGPLNEASYEPEAVQFYTVKGVDPLSEVGMDFNRELRRVGYGYVVDRKTLRLD